MTPMYIAHAVAEGGRQGRAHSDDGQIDLKLTVPREMGGPGGEGTNPEQLFAAGYAACFKSAMQFVGGQKQLNLEGAKVTAHVGIGQNDNGAGFALAVTQDVELPNLDQAVAQALVDEAHAVCPYSNATRGNVDVRFNVRGRA